LRNCLTESLLESSLLELPPAAPAPVAGALVASLAAVVLAVGGAEVSLSALPAVRGLLGLTWGWVIAMEVMLTMV